MMIESGATMLTNAGHKRNKRTIGWQQQIQVNLVLQAVQLATGSPSLHVPSYHNVIQFQTKSIHGDTTLCNTTGAHPSGQYNAMKRSGHSTLQCNIAMLRNVALMQSNAGSAYPWTIAGNPWKGNALPPNKHFHTSAYFGDWWSLWGCK